MSDFKWTAEEREAVAEALWRHDGSDFTPEWLDMAWADMGGSEKSETRVEYELPANAALDALAPFASARAALTPQGGQEAARSGAETTDGHGEDEAYQLRHDRFHEWDRRVNGTHWSER